MSLKIVICYLLRSYIWLMEEGCWGDGHHYLGKHCSSGWNSHQKGWVIKKAFRGQQWPSHRPLCKSLSSLSTPPHSHPPHTDLLPVTRELSAFLDFSINEIKQHVLYFGWLLSLNIIILRFIHRVARCPYFIPFYCWVYSTTGIYCNLFLHSPLYGLLDGFSIVWSYYK